MSTNRTIQPLTQGECMALLDACSRRAPTGVRNAAIIVTAWRAGLRCGELLDLYPRDLDLAAHLITVAHGKGDRHRVVAIDLDALQWIQRWLDYRDRLGLTGHMSLYCTLNGGRLSDAYVRALLRRLGRKAGITKRVHPHGLRHTHAYELAQEGVSMPMIQSQLGHASLSTTQIYVNHFSPADRVKVMDGRKMPS